MDHKAHVALVDAHAKSYSRDHHRDFPLNPCGVDPLALLGIKVAVIEGAGHRVLGHLKSTCECLGLLASDAIDDPRRSTRELVNGHAYCGQDLCRRLRPVADFVEEVRPVGGRAELNCPHTEALLHVRGDCRRGRSCERKQWGLWELDPQSGQLLVVGPEVVAPLRDAVRLVHGDEPQLARGIDLLERGHHQLALRKPLWGQVQHT